MKERRQSQGGELGKAAIIVAHPGHELIVYHWMERHQPLYRCLTDGSGALVERRSGRTLLNLDFVLDAPPGAAAESTPPETLRLALDEAAVERKLRAALNYPEMRVEVQAALLSHGKRAFAVECLRPATTAAMVERFEKEPPAYERLGQIRVNEGRYGEVVRYRQHVLPIRAAIERAVRP